MKITRWRRGRRIAVISPIGYRFNNGSLNLAMEEEEKNIRGWPG